MVVVKSKAFLRALVSDALHQAAVTQSYARKATQYEKIMLLTDILQDPVANKQARECRDECLAVCATIQELATIKEVGESTEVNPPTNEQPTSS